MDTQKGFLLAKQNQKVFQFSIPQAIFTLFYNLHNNIFFSPEFSNDIFNFGSQCTYSRIFYSLRFAQVLVECDLELKPMLEKIFTLYALTVVERNLPWFILSDTLTTEQGLQVRGLFV